MIRCVLAAVALAAFALPAGSETVSDGTSAAKETKGAARQCDTAKRRVAKEEDSLAFVTAELERDVKERSSCATTPACARYDAAIRTMEDRKSRHETRLAKFRAEAVQICTSE